jgi:CRISPR-associated protein Csm2
MTTERRFRDRGGDAFQPTPQAILQKIITDAEGAQVLIEEADRIGKALAPPGDLTTSQIRTLFREVRSIEGDWQIDKIRARHRLHLLKPKMAYRAARAKAERKTGVGHLAHVLSDAIDFVNGEEDNFRRFVEFFEAILAYHKVHGGRD